MADQAPHEPLAAGAPPGPRGRSLFDEQRRNRRDTWLLVAGFVAFLAVLGLGFDLFLLGAPGTLDVGGAMVPVPIGASAAMLVGAGSAYLGYRFGDRAILASSAARPVASEDDSPEIKRLMNVVTEMAIAGGLPMPRVYLVDDPDPNAFATGRDPDHASIAVTTGLLHVMSRDELQGVVAHEMAHVRNYDIRKMTIVAALLGAVLLISDWAGRLRFHLPAAERSDRSDDRRKGGGLGALGLILFAVWLLAVILAPLIGRILATAVSRRREYLADASGAELTRNPLGLAGALRKLDAAAGPTARIHRGTAHLCIADPLGRAVNERTGWLADLLATHPPIADRVTRLETMAYRRQP